jgi:hypothetical protein
LAVGRQLAAWWNDSGLESLADPGSITGPGTAWTEPDDLQLGELETTIHRRRVSGSREAAWSALEISTRNTAREAGWPESEADQDERRLLAVLAGREPPTSQQATTSLHRLEGPLPMVVAVRRLLGERRVVGWGLATRTPRDDWVTWTFAAAGDVATDPVDLPANSRRLLAVGSGAPERLLVFSGSPGPDGWWRHFDGELRRGGWTPTAPRSQHPTGWTARWRHPGGRALVVSARHDNSGRWHGMLNVFTPTRSGPSTTSPPERVQQEST